MPVVQLQDDTGANLGAALGAVGGYFATKKARGEEQARQRSQEDAASQRAAQDMAIRAQEATIQKTTFDNTQDRLNREKTAEATMDQMLGKAPELDPSNPAPYITYATKAARYFAGLGLAGSETGKFWTTESQRLPQGYQQFTGGQKNVAGAELDKARKNQILNWKTIADHQVQNEIKKLQASEQGRAQIATMNQAAAFARAQLAQSGANQRAELAQGGANQRAQMSEDERTLIAQMTALNAASGQNFAQAFQAAKTKYEGQLKAWQTDQTTGEKAQATGQQVPADYGQPAPQFNFSISMPSAQPTVIAVPGPNGQMIPVVTRNPQGPATGEKKPTANANPKSGTQKPPQAPAPSPAPASGGQSALGLALDWIKQHLGGGQPPAPSGAASPAPARPAMGGYQIGHVYGTLRYLGGDPHDKASWQ